MTAATAQAARKTSNGGTQLACDGGLCVTATFRSSWNVGQGNSEGTHYWAISLLNPYAVLGNAKQAAATLGVEPLQGIKVEALNASGAIVRTITLTQHSSCGQTGAIGTNDLMYDACRSYVEVPLSVTKLRFVVKVEDPSVFGPGWAKTWTANIT